jgi:hypothetical protein
MFDNLMKEVEAIRGAWGYGVLEAIEFILDNREEYDEQINRELRTFMAMGSKMFAPVEA